MLNKLSKKSVNRLWKGSLIVVSAILLILFGASLLGLELPMWMIRVLGGIDLLCIPLLVWTTCRKFKLKLHISKKTHEE